MMRCWKAMVLALTLGLIVAVGPLPAQAASAPAKPATMTVKVVVTAPPIFWNYTFLTRDYDFGKPAAIRVGWVIGDGTTRDDKYQTVVESAKDSGQITIQTEREALVTLQVRVIDAKRIVLGTYNLSVVNKGQTETITVAPPEFTEPVFTWGG